MDSLASNGTLPNGKGHPAALCAKVFRWASEVNWPRKPPLCFETNERFTNVHSMWGEDGAGSPVYNESARKASGQRCGF